MVQAVIYARVSTQDQDCDRQVRDLTSYAERLGYDVVGVFTEKASGGRKDRAERRKVITLAQSGQIQAILVTELNRWGRSTQDLLQTLQELSNWRVSLLPMNGMQMDLSTPMGKFLTTMLAGLAEFEKDLIRERTISGLAAAKARGKKLGRPKGFNPSDTIAPHVLSMVADGLPYRSIAEKLSISKTTVVQIVKRSHANVS